MTPDEWKARAITHLRQLENRADESINSGGSADCLQPWFEYEDGIAEVRAAFPKKSRQQADEWLAKQSRKGKGGGRPAKPLTLSENKLWQAAARARSLSKLWATLHPERPRPHAPVDPEDIVAERYGIRPEQVHEYARREASRWPDKRRP